MSTNPRKELEEFFEQLGEPFTITEDPETGELSGSTCWIVELAPPEGAERRRGGSRRSSRRRP
jgi:hypothetical protein